MPIYEYRCQKGHSFEVMQSMSDDPLTSCTSCSASVERVFHPVAVHFKGSGFYTTDYGRNRSEAGAAADSSSQEEAKKEEAKKGTPAGADRGADRGAGKGSSTPSPGSSDD